MKKILGMIIFIIGLHANQLKPIDIEVHGIGYFSLNKESFFKKYIGVYCINGVRYLIMYGSTKLGGISPMYNQRGDIMTCTIRKDD